MKGRPGWDHGEFHRRFGGFLRTLLAGIPWSERAEGQDELRLEAPRGGTVRVDNANGNTQVIGEERDDVWIEIERAARAESQEEAERLLKSIRVLARTDGAGNLEIEVDIPGRWNRRGRADLVVHVPAKTSVQVLAANGRICVSGLHGGVRVRSSNGGVRVSEVVGNVEIHTSNAKVLTQCICGRLLARSSNGKIQLEGHRGSIDAATSNGTIACDLDEDVDGDVDIRVDNGLIRSHREVRRASKERGGRLKGTLGRGGPPIRLRASNGSISLH
jgi:hypothetical protein